MKFLLAVFLMSFASSAAAETIFCDSCTPIQQRARLTTSTIGTYYLYDRTSDAISKWVKEKDCSTNICSTVIRQAPVEIAVLNYVNFYKTNKSHSLPLADNGTFPGDAYEGVGFPQLSTNVGNYIKNSGLGYVQDYLNFAGSVGGVVGFNIHPLEMTIRVNFSDGSTALYIYNHTTQTWDRLKGQSRDSNGNLIPETVSTVSGGGPGTSATYHFDGSSGASNLINFLNLLNQLGVSISGPIGTGHAIVCVSDSNGTYCESSP